MDGGVGGLWTGFLQPEWKVTVGESAAQTDASATRLHTADDLTLVRAAIEGLSGAFDVIVERHRRAIYQLCYRYVANHEDASDLTQEVFLRAYRGLRRFRGEASLRTWLYRIAVNVSLNQVTSTTPTVERVESAHHLGSQGDDPARVVLRTEQRARVRAAIARLPKRQRAVLVLRVYEELSHREIAQIVGSSVGAVKANFFHALGNLKKLIREP